jgi:hypothetical protein
MIFEYRAGTINMRQRSKGVGGSIFRAGNFLQDPNLDLQLEVLDTDPFKKSE